MEQLDTSSPVVQVGIRIAGVAVCVAVVMFLVYLLKKIYAYTRYWYYSDPWLFKGTKSGKKKIVIPQNPNQEDAITLMRSNNESGGLEYTYMCWLYVDDWSYRQGEWKHVFHKGNATSEPLRSPGVWFHPNTNALRVYTNTFADPYEFADVDNLPQQKWFHLAICVQQKNLDVFVNGNLATRLVLQGLPRQNYGDVYINMNNGFSGYISNVRYYPSYVSFGELEEMIQRGPSMIPIADKADTPPYFANMWWANRG
jgi:hypothetical protein